MPENNDPRGDRNDWGVVLAVSLIVVGLWFLIGTVAGPRWQMAMRTGAEIVWPLALVALGVLLFLSSRRGAQPSVHSGRRLYRSRRTRMIGGVLGGVADYFDVDPTIVRVAYVILAYLSGVFAAVVAYVIAAIVIPEEPANYMPASRATGPASASEAAPASPPPAAGSPDASSPRASSSDDEAEPAAAFAPTPPPAPPVPPAADSGWPHTGESGSGGSQ